MAGLPKDVTIAHKFGEHVSGSNGVISSVELHDCGIVYAPKKPYLLCVMTRGSDFDKLSGIIKSISNMVYEGVTEDL